MTASATVLDRAALVDLIEFTARETVDAGIAGPEALAAVLTATTGLPVTATDLADLADALADVAAAESPTEAALRQPSVDEITRRIVDGRNCAVTR